MAPEAKQTGSLGTKSVQYHRLYGGTMQTMPKCPVRDRGRLRRPADPKGVAERCRAIHATPEPVYELINKGNLVAVVSDGSRVLWLGDICPAAGLARATSFPL